MSDATTTERPTCSACGEPAVVEDYARRRVDGRPLLWCEAHCSYQEYVSCRLDDDDPLGCPKGIAVAMAATLGLLGVVAAWAWLAVLVRMP